MERVTNVNVRRTQVGGDAARILAFTIFIQSVRFFFCLFKFLIYWYLMCLYIFILLRIIKF